MKKRLFTAAAVIALTYAGAAWANADASASAERHPMMESALSQLPPQKAEAVKQKLKQAREQNKPLRDQARALHEQLHAVLVAPQFDESTFIAKKKQLEGLQDQMRANMTQAFASAASQLTQSERVTLATAMQKQRHHAHDAAAPQGAPPASGSY